MIIIEVHFQPSREMCTLFCEHETSYSRYSNCIDGCIYGDAQAVWF